MEEIKEENVLNECKVRGECLRNALDKVNAHASDVLVFSVQWKDLNEYLESVYGKVKERFRELESKEFELKGQSYALEERARKVEEAEGLLADLEVRSDGLRMDVEERKKEVNFLTKQVEVSLGESNAEEMRLSKLRRLVEECEAEQMLKESQRSEMVELLRKTLVELGLKGDELAKMETGLERCRDDVSAEMESLSRAQTQRRQLDEEVERKRKDLTLVQDKLAECEKVLECKREHLGQMEADLEKELWERTQTHSRELEEEMERKRKDLKVVLDKIAQLESVEEQLDSQQKLLEKRSSELVSKEEKLKLLSLEIVFEEKTLLRAQDFSKKLSERQDLAEKKLDSTRSHLEICISEHESARKELCAVKDRYRECLEDLDIKEKELKSVESILTERNKQVEEGEKKMQHLSSSSEELNRQLKLKEKEVCSIRNTIIECSCELEAKRKQRDQVQSSLTDLIAELKSEESQLNSVKQKIQDSLKEFQSKEEEHARLRATLMDHEQELSAREAMIDNKAQKLKSKEQKLAKSSKKTEQARLKALMEREQGLELREKELSDMEARIDNKAQQLKSKEQKLAKSSKKTEQARLKALMEREQGLELREKELSDMEARIDKKAQQLKSTEQKLARSSKKTAQANLKASLMEREKGLELKEKELSVRETRIKKKAQQVKSTELKLAKPSKKTKLKAKKQVDLVREANVRDEKTLQLLLRGHMKKRDQIHLDVLSSVKISSNPAKLVLDTIIMLYSSQQRTAVKNLDPKIVQRSSICLLECLIDMSSIPTTEVQEEAIKFANEWKNTTLVNSDSPVEVLEFINFLAAFSLAYTFDADNVQNLFNVAFLSKYGPSLCKALGVSALAPINNVLLLEDKPEEQPTEAPISNSMDSRSPDVQQSMASYHLPDEDALRDFEDSTYFSPNEVSTQLPVFKKPGRIVLNAVEDALTNARLRGESCLGEPILVNLIPLLEELARVVCATDPGLQYDATRVAQRWVRMMEASVERSQLEVWAFLQFIVAFGLVGKLTKQDQTLQLASCVAHFRQAPKLFQSLGLSDAIPNFVTELVNKAMFIPAIRFMFYFNVENNFFPLELLKKEIINLRHTVKEKRQAEANRDAATLREMMELIEDFQLEIDIPVALILKFMVPREIQNLPVQSTPMQVSDTDIQSSGIATHGSDQSLPTSFVAAPNQPVHAETYHAGGSAEFQGQSSLHAGSKRPRVVDLEGPRQVIRPCLNPPSGFGEF